MIAFKFFFLSISYFVILGFGVMLAFALALVMA
jgi:hypothetical protein